MSGSHDDTRLIEDYIPVEAISAVASSEKVGGRKGHPALLHLWWARRPLAAARAAVYATLVPSDGTPQDARSADFFHSLCRWGASDAVIAQARERVLAANGGVPPKVLDMFAGGGAIPLEAARLGCEATAVELNPVAHLIEKCMLDYPQRFGRSLADDIRTWGERWVAAAWERVGHLYPPTSTEGTEKGERLFTGGVIDAEERAAGRPIAYLWTRTVPCPNSAVEAHDVPLVRQTWLSKKPGRFTALRPIVDRGRLALSWKVVQADSVANLGFDPSAFSSRGHSTCLICGAAVDPNYVKQVGRAGLLGIASLATVMRSPVGPGRIYVSHSEFSSPPDSECAAVIAQSGIEVPNESIVNDATRDFRTPLYGLPSFGSLFTPRQAATLCTFVAGVRETFSSMMAEGMAEDRAVAVATYLALVADRLADWGSSLCRWHPGARQEGVMNTFPGHSLPMIWDFAEANPFGGSSGDALRGVVQVAEAAAACQVGGPPSHIWRSSATSVASEPGSFDAVITDPPYYDNIAYADLSDFFYVWLKRSIGSLHPDDFSGELTPKRHEAIMAPYRHHGDKGEARGFYEEEMAAAFGEAHRVLKAGAPLVCVYAHKTTLGWSSLVEALRTARFAISEAWPIDTELRQRSVGQGTSSLASSIFLVARRRDEDAVGSVGEVRRELDGIVEERLGRLLDAGVSGADLVIATVGAGLRAFTRYASVELPNGEPLPAKDFLEEVQGRVLNAVLGRVHGLSDGAAAAVDAETRYYVLSRYSYGYGPIDFDEANNLARTAGVELGDLGSARPPLAKLAKGKAELLDYADRGEVEPNGDGRTRMIDVLHGVLWRAGHAPATLPEFLDRTHADPEALRVVAQAIAGPALAEGSESKAREPQACERLLGAWPRLIGDGAQGRLGER